MEGAGKTPRKKELSHRPSEERIPDGWQVGKCQMPAERSSKIKTENCPQEL